MLGDVGAPALALVQKRTLAGLRMSMTRGTLPPRRPSHTGQLWGSAKSQRPSSDFLPCLEAGGCRGVACSLQQVSWTIYADLVP